MNFVCKRRCHGLSRAYAGYPYSRDFLLKLSGVPSDPSELILWADNIPPELQRGQKRKRKRRTRGSRGGIRNRLRRRGSRLPLPAITLSNVRSLRNKADELATLIKSDPDYQRTSLFCFTETWLSEGGHFELDGYNIIRFDRDAVKTRKSIGGGVCMAVNKKWATNYKVRETECCKHYELITVSFRPHYLPREFTQLTVILVYVPGPDFNLAAERIAESYNKIVSKTGEQPVFILGDFNKCNITTHLSSLEQYVTIPTRGQNMLDLCYGNVPGAFVSKPRPPLGLSDHNVILLLPKYRSRLKAEGLTTKTIRVWNEEAAETLKGCFEMTQWDLFFNDCGTDLNMLSDVLTSYIMFCEENVTTTKHVTIHPNNKKWVTKDMKACLVEKKKAFLQGDKARVRELQKDFRRQARWAKMNYKDKVERKLTSGNARQAWQGLNTMMGRKPKPEVVDCPDPASLAEQLNNLFTRFNSNSTTCTWTPETHSRSLQPIIVSEQLVTSILRRVNPNKAAGPDRLRGRVLKECHIQLSGVLTRLFQLLLDSGTVPERWKESTIIPLPKKARPKDLQDYRPVSLTSILCKCMERVVADQLVAELSDKLDPLQFAYRAKRGTEDASLLLLDRATKQLDSTHPQTRILFMDFSSAFSTVNNNALLHHLSDLQIHPTLILWIQEFLRDRPQQVFLNGFKSTKLVLKTGLPQGCVVSPILFSVYTNHISCNREGLTLIKYADDMALVAHITDSQALTQFQLEVNTLVQTFAESALELNISKTKELCCGVTEKSLDLFQPLCINGQQVEQVDSFKYLGTEIDTCLSFGSHVDSVFKKAQQRLHLLRKLRHFNISKDILTLVYTSLIESIITYNISSWFNFLTIKHKTKLSRVINQASKITQTTQTPLCELYRRSVLRKATLITEDCSHPLHHSFTLLPSGRRYRTPLARKNIYKKSFIPTAITALNNTK